MTSILGGGDPAFYHSDRDAEEAQRELQIRYEDSFLPNGERVCIGCDKPYDPSTMYDEKDGDFTFKICASCGGAGAPSYRLNFEPSDRQIATNSMGPIQYESSPIPSTNALGETVA